MPYNKDYIKKVIDHIDTAVEKHSISNQQVASVLYYLFEAVIADVYLRKDKNDKTPFLLELLAGANFGNYSKNQSGANIDKDGAAEFATLLLRGALTIGNYIEKKQGGKITEQGVADLMSAIIRDKVESADFLAGALGQGFTLKKKSDGKSYLEVDELYARVKAIFAALEIRNLMYCGGNFIFSPAGMKCTKVEEFDTFYRCFFTSDDGSKAVENTFEVDDQVQMKEFNIKPGIYQNISNRYFWRKCIAKGDDYIDLSKEDRDLTSDDAPLEGDSLVTIGNKTIKERQNAIIISVYGEGSPSITQHIGINTYSLVGTEKTRISPTQNIFTGEFHFSSGENVKDITTGLNQKLNDAITDLSNNIALVKIIQEQLGGLQDQIDGVIEFHQGDYTPTINNEPAVSWTTDEIKQSHINDTFMNPQTGESWRWGKVGDTWQWIEIADTALKEALQKAMEALGVANSKMKVFDRVPTSEDEYNVGDLWVNATYSNTYSNDFLRCKTAKAKGTPFSIEHWEKATKYTDDTTANKAIADAANAQQAADNADQKAQEATNRLNNWAADGTISPTEKPALKDEIARIDSDKEQITAGYTKYGLGTPSAFTSAYSSYRAQLVTLTASSPESITIPSDFRTKQTTYYTQRSVSLNAIAAAAKDLADSINTDLQGYKTTVESKFSATNDKITAAVTETKTYTDSKVSEVVKVVDSKLEIAKGEITAEVTSTVDNKINNIQVGGRNYIVNTGGSVSFSPINQSNYTYIGKWKIKKEASNIGNFTFGAKVKFEGCSYNANSTVVFQLVGHNGWNWFNLSKDLSVSEDGEYLLLLNDRKLEYPLATEDGSIQLRVDYIGGGTITISEMRLYAGTKDLGWTHAPEDTEKSISDLSVRITITEEGIKQTVTKTEFNQYKTDVGNTYATKTVVSQMQTSIDSLGTEISLKASKSELTTVKNELTGNINSLTQRVTQAEIKLQPDNIWIGISSKVDSVVNDIQIGGRNYLQGTNNGKTNWSITVANGTTTIYDEIIRNINSLKIYVDKSSTEYHVICYNINAAIKNLVKGKTYTLSFDVYSTENLTIDAKILRANGLNNIVNFTPVVNTIQKNVWTKAIFVGTLGGQDSYYENLSQTIYLTGFNITGLTAYIQNPKLEEGNKATDWTPAPEDLASKSELEQTGIYVGSRKIIAQADTFKFLNNAGQEIAVFENNKLKTSLIDADELFSQNITVSNNATITNLRAVNADVTGKLTASSGSQIGGMLVQTNFLSFIQDQKDIRIGNSVYPPSSSISGFIYLKDTTDNTFERDAIYIDVKTNKTSEGGIVDNRTYSKAIHIQQGTFYIAPGNLVDTPGVLLAGRVNGDGSIVFQYGKQRYAPYYGKVFYVDAPASSGWIQYNIRHNIGHTNYSVNITPISGGTSFRKYHAHIIDIQTNSFLVCFIDSGTANSTLRSDFYFSVIGENN